MGSLRLPCFVFVFTLLLIISSSLAQELISCGGNVKPSAHLSKSLKTKLDISDVKVQLLNHAGVVKYEAAPAPSGYYIVPVYENIGGYVLKIQGPDGWTFSPSIIPLNLENNQCNGGNDINFELTGFRVSGNVMSSPSCQSGSKPHIRELVQLIDNSDSVIASTKTSESDGSFAFENVSPGSYRLLSSGTSTPVQVLGANLQVRPPIYATGYSISGKLVDSSNALEGIHHYPIVLYSRVPFTPSASSGCNESLLPTFEPSSNGKPVCVIQTENGKFQFDHIPCGTYNIVPHAPNGITGINIYPRHQSVQLDAADVELEHIFKLEDFTVTGQVVNAKRKGVADASIVITSTGTKDTLTYRGKTDQDGKYSIEKVKKGDYKIFVSKEHYIFPEHVVHLSPKSARIEDITVSQIEVCGKVSIPHPPAGTKTGAHRQVSIKSASLDASTQTDSSGSYCVKVVASSEPQTVTVSIKLSQSEKAAGLLLSTTESTFAIDTIPITNVDFVQSLLAIRGSVQCLKRPCDNSVSVQLTPASGEETITTGLSLASATKDDDRATFEFPMLIPGQYVITIAVNEWCWQEEQQTVTLTDSDISNIVFVQSGYYLTIKASHPMQVLVQHSSDFKQTVELVSGSNKICLNKSGTYSILPQTPCYQLEKESYQFSTDANSLRTPVELTVKKVKVSGTISIPSSAHQVKATATIARPAKEQAASIKSLDLLTNPKTPNVFTWELWAELGDSIIVQPESATLLFYPLKSTHQLAQVACHIHAPTIQGREGMWITGKVTPTVPGLTLQVLDESDKVVIEKVIPDSNGNYKAGPLYDDKSYTVTANANGFHLKQETVESSPNVINFRALKLGSLKVSVLEGGKPVVSALLSLSGPGYRSNLATDEEGKVTFSNIFPGDYYMMPLLKEYTFSKDFKPKTIQQHQQPITVTVTEKDDQILNLIGTRVAYSCYGKVTSLNGQPEKNVMIEARSGQLVEQAQTDHNGKYRLRGLVPGNSYTIGISSETTYIEQTSPSLYTLPIGQEDITNKDFLAFRKTSAKYEVFGRVLTNSSVLPHLTVQLWEIATGSGKPGSEPSKDAPAREIRLMNDVNFFAFGSLSHTKYSLKLKADSGLNRAVYTFNLDEATKTIIFSPDQPIQNVDLSLFVESALESVEIPTGQVLATIIAIAAFGAFYYRSKILKMVGAKQSGNASHSKQNRAEKEDQFVANLKKFSKSN